MPSSSDSAHKYLIEYLARNGTAFAQGNGYVSYDEVNAIAHAWTSAEATFRYGREDAERLGNLKDPQLYDPDAWRDHWNNEVGRRMAEWAWENGYGPEALDRLMYDAMQSGALIVDPRTDPRIGIHDFDGDGVPETFVEPNPTWQAPQVWDPSVWGTPADDPIAPRDYSGLPDPAGELRDWLFNGLEDILGWIENFGVGLLNLQLEALVAIQDMLRDALYDPLVLDLDGDGIELIALSSSATHFDLDEDGIAERAGWVSPHDGLLVQDANGNGAVDGVAELIGSGSVDGFDELATLDANGDGKVDANDPAFAQMLVWRDLNADGAATPEEMLTLAEAGIASFGLAYSQVDDDVNGNVVARIGSYARNAGASRTMASVQFALDQTAGRPALPAGADVGNLFVLPNLPGSAAIPDLRTAMYFDPVLKGMVEDLVFGSHDFQTFAEFTEAGFVEIIYRWTGTDTSAPPDPNRPYYYDVFEALTGMRVDPDSHSDLEQLATVWPELLKHLGVQFLFQATHMPAMKVFYDLVQDLEALDPTAATYADARLARTDAAIAEIATVGPSYDYLEDFAGLTLKASTGTLSGDFDAFVARFIADQPSFLTTSFVGGGGSGRITMKGDDGDSRHVWTGWYEDQGSLLFHVASAMGMGVDYVLNVTGWRWLTGEATDLHGTGGGDLIDQAVTYYFPEEFSSGGGGTGTVNPGVETRDQRMFGYEGDDELRGNDGVDRLVGGTGNDLMKGGSGSDMYVYASGDGLDRVTDESGSGDTIYFSSELDGADLRVSRVTGTNDLQLHFGDTGQGIVLTAQWSSSAAAIEHLHFVGQDGMDAGDIAGLYLATLATGGADAIGGSWAGERMIGLDGNDTLNGNGGDDDIAGDGGDDLLSGDAGDDRLGGGAGVDQLSGQAGNDTLDGGAGNDLLRGGGDDDTYLFALGGGQDIVRDYIAATLVNYGGSDTVRLAAGIAPADVTVAQADAGTDLVLTFAGSADKLTLDETTNDSGYRIERLIFADGTIWTHADMFARATAPTAADDLFYGGYGDESLAGGAGNDTLIANRGDDIMDGGAGNDLLRGGGGDDTYVFAAGAGQDIVRDHIANTLVNYGGSDTILFAGSIASSAITVSQGDSGDDLIIAIAGTADRITLDETMDDSDYRIERVQFADGTVLTHANLFALATTPTGGNDVFYGSYDNESLAGGGGADTLIANRGNDVLDGGVGNDVLRGGGGNDVYLFALGGGQDSVRDYIAATLVNYGGTDAVQLAAGIAPGDVIVVQGDEGDDLVLRIGTGGDRITLEETVSDSNYRIEQVRFADAPAWTHADLVAFAKTPKASGDSYWGGSGADSLAGGGGADIIYGRAGDDSLGGDEGSDSLYGEDGLDSLSGGDGNDVLSGGAGNDVLIGGTGADVLTGGTGADTFRFAGQTTGLAAAADRIADFAAALDKIDLAAIDANAALAGDQAFAFIGGAAFSGAAGELRCVTAGTERRLQMDTDGDMAADLEIVLTGTASLAATDFVL